MPAPASSPARPHVRVRTRDREYLIEVDVRDVDVARIAAAYTANGALEIHARRVNPVDRPLELIHAEAEPC